MTEIDIHVFTWNAGKFTDKKLDNFFKEIEKKIENTNGIIVIGFQELNGQEFTAKIKNKFMTTTAWNFCKDKSKQIGYKMTCSHTFQITKP